MTKIKRALISVSDKSGIIKLAKFLQKQNIEIISTGGTFKLLRKNNIEAKDISEFTGFSEIMDGRVKTLHPKVHGGLLGVLDNKEHQKQAQKNNILAIDLVVINLYPFIATVKKGATYNEVIENIDIGGPSMIRSAAKNYIYKTIITNVEDYQSLEEEIQKNDGDTSLEYRKSMARKAFSITAHYDQAIASYFNKDQNINFSPTLNLPASLKQNLRYGENSHQKAAVYVDDFADCGIVSAIQLQGKELSYNNFNDADAAFNIALEFDEPMAVIVKHANPCGAALGDNINLAYKKAFEADSKSAFGGILALNRKIDKELATEISKIFFEVIIAPDFSDPSLEIFAKKKNLRLLKINFKRQKNQKQIKSISGGFLVQDIDNKKIKQADLQNVGEVTPNSEQILQQIFAIKICKHIKSNAIIIVNDFQSVGISAGQMNRVGAVEIACQKANNFITLDGKILDKASGAILASDAFFPFADNIEIANQYGIGAIITPDGSIRDKEVILAANKYKIALSFIKTRHFRH